MPLASTAALQWYGPAAAAMRVTTAAGASNLSLHGVARLGEAVTGAGVATLLKATRLRNRPLYVTGTGSAVLGPMKGRANMGMTVKVNQLSQDDVAGALGTLPIEGGFTLKDAIRLLLAAAQGNATGLESTSIAFKSIDGSKTRVAGTVVAGTRTITTRDAT